MKTTTKLPSVADRLAEFKKRQSDLRDAHNARCTKARKGEISWQDSIRQYHLGEAEYQILEQEMERDGLQEHILNKTITFQSGAGFAGNHELGEALEKQFPEGKDDSESGQGFFYINEKFVPQVLKWLAGKVEIGQMSDVRFRQQMDELNAKAKGCPAVGVSKTVSLMIK